MNCSDQFTLAGGQTMPHLILRTVALVQHCVPSCAPEISSTVQTSIFCCSFKLSVQHFNSISLLEEPVFSPFPFTLDSPRSQSDLLRPSATGSVRLNCTVGFLGTLLWGRAWQPRGSWGAAWVRTQVQEKTRNMASLGLFAALLSSHLPVSKLSDRFKAQLLCSLNKAAFEQEGK